MFNFKMAAYADLSYFEPEYLRHVSDDVTAHWEDVETAELPALSQWEIFASRREAAEIEF